MSRENKGITGFLGILAQGWFGFTDTMVCGKPTVAEFLPHFIEFLGGMDTILLAHNARFDLSYLGIALTKMKLDFPPHAVIDTLELAKSCLREPIHYRLEDLAIYLGVAGSDDHRALSDARILAQVFQMKVTRTRRLATVDNLFRICEPLSFGDGISLEPPADFEELAVAIDEQCTLVMIYDGGTRGTVERRVTPRGLLQSGGCDYLTAFCHTASMEKTIVQTASASSGLSRDRQQAVIGQNRACRTVGMASIEVALLLSLLEERAGYDWEALEREREERWGLWDQAAKEKVLD